MSKLFVFFLLISLSAKIAYGQKSRLNNKTLNPVSQSDIDFIYNAIGRQVKYPDEDRKNGVTGVVVVTFKINSDYNIDDIRVLRAPSITLGDAVSKILKGMRGPINLPKKLSYVLPIRFEMDNGEDDVIGVNYKAPAIDDDLSKITHSPALLLHETRILILRTISDYPITTEPLPADSRIQWVKIAPAIN